MHPRTGSMWPNQEIAGARWALRMMMLAMCAGRRGRRETDCEQESREQGTEG